MVLIYKTDKNEYYTLTELVQKFPKEWETALKSEAKFWGELYLVDLIAEASDEFEEILANMDIFVEPIGSISNDDLNILLKPLW